MRNSTTPTVLSAGYKVNVIPGVAHALVDARVLPGTDDELLAELDRLLGPGVHPRVRRDTSRRCRRRSTRRGSPRWPPRCAPRTRRGGGAVLHGRRHRREGVRAAWASTATGSPRCGLPEGFDHRLMAHGVDERVPVEGLRFGVDVLDRFLSAV